MTRVMVLLAAGLVLTACGPSDSQATTPASATAPTAAAPQPTQPVDDLPGGCTPIGTWRDSRPFFESDVFLCEGPASRWAQWTFDNGSTWASELEQDGERMIASNGDWYVLTASGALQVWDEDGLIVELTD